MKKIKHNPDAPDLISEYVNKLPTFSKEICLKLRKIILETDSTIIEDWKWGPNYYNDGMVCGFGAFQKHVKLTFFNGSAMKDAKKIFNHCIDNEFSRSIKYTTVNEIDEKMLGDYIKKSIAINKKGFKREIKNKKVIIPADFKKILSKNKIAEKNFTILSYGYQKEYIEWIEEAKKEGTREKRIEQTIEKLKNNQTLNDKYKKEK